MPLTCGTLGDSTALANLFIAISSFFLGLSFAFYCSSIEFRKIKHNLEEFAQKDLEHLMQAIEGTQRK